MSNDKEKGSGLVTTKNGKPVTTKNGKPVTVDNRRTQKGKK
jgi:hypothetical protein